MNIYIYVLIYYSQSHKKPLFQDSCSNMSACHRHNLYLSLSLSTYNISLIFTCLGYNSSFLKSWNLVNWNNTSPNLGISLKYRDFPLLNLVLPTWNPSFKQKKHITLPFPKTPLNTGSPSDHSKVSGSMVPLPGSADRLGPVGDRFRALRMGLVGGWLIKGGCCILTGMILQGKPPTTTHRGKRRVSQPLSPIRRVKINPNDHGGTPVGW